MRTTLQWHHADRPCYVQIMMTAVQSSMLSSKICANMRSSVQKQQHFVWVDGVAHFAFSNHKGRRLEDVADLHVGFLVCNSKMTLCFDSAACETSVLTLLSMQHSSTGMCCVAAFRFTVGFS